MQTCLKKQPAATSINRGWPHYGRSETDHGFAIFAASAYLEALGLNHMTSRVIHWLGRYEGFEEYVEVEHDPVIAVRDLLAGYVITGKRNVADNKSLLHELVRGISKLDFMYYKAFWGDDPMLPTGGKKLWNPAHQSWMSFIEQRQPGEEIWVWKSETPHISESQLQAILLQDDA